MQEEIELEFELCDPEGKEPGPTEYQVLLDGTPIGWFDRAGFYTEAETVVRACSFGVGKALELSSRQLRQLADAIDKFAATNTLD